MLLLDLQCDAGVWGALAGRASVGDGIDPADRPYLEGRAGPGRSLHWQFPLSTWLSQSLGVVDCSWTSPMPAGLMMMQLVLIVQSAFVALVHAQHATSTLSGSLLYLDFKQPGFNMQLVALDIVANATSPVLPLGHGESFFAQVSATSEDGSMYYATVQYKKDPSDPTKGVYAQTLGIALHDESVAAEGNQADKARIKYMQNTSTCWSLAVDEASADTVLCLSEGPCHDTNTSICKTVSATTSLVRLDLAAGESVVVGRFPEGQIVENQAAAYDSKAGVYYAMLTGGVAAMDVKTGQVLWQKSFVSPDGQDYMVHDFAIDAGASRAYAACSILTSRSPVTWGSAVATLDLSGGTMSLVPLTTNDIFGTTVSGRCSKPGTSKGAAAKCYGQINDGFIGDGVFFVTAFAGGPPETVLGVDLQSGAVVFEQGPTDAKGGNLIDMAWVPSQLSETFLPAPREG